MPRTLIGIAAVVIGVVARWVRWVYGPSMAKRTIKELYEARTICEAEIGIAAATAIYEPARAVLQFTTGHTLDLRGTIAGSETASAAVGDDAVSSSERRTTVLAAILLARPIRP